jgi:hypothetical protein
LPDPHGTATPPHPFPRVTRAISTLGLLAAVARRVESGEQGRPCATICRRRRVRECRSASRRCPRTPADRIPAAQSRTCGDAADRRPRRRRARCARRACLSWSPQCGEEHWRRRARFPRRFSCSYSGHRCPVNRCTGVSVGVSLEGGRIRHLRYHNPAGHADCQRVSDVVPDFPTRPGRSLGCAFSRSATDPQASKSRVRLSASDRNRLSGSVPGRAQGSGALEKRERGRSPAVKTPSAAAWLRSWRHRDRAPSSDPQRT